MPTRSYLPETGEGEADREVARPLADRLEPEGFLSLGRLEDGFAQIAGKRCAACPWPAASRMCTRPGNRPMTRGSLGHRV
ncbi:MAG: hypothetical protein GY937_14325 [bacterium]|nr:hypothetical protein [bacterium]